MRRADRLFQITQILRGRRQAKATTARHLAERLQVTERTIYRDIRDLSLSGVPIEGEAGIGYRLQAGFDIPPLMFNLAEIQTVVAGLRLIGSWGGHAMADHAQSVLEKISAVVPHDKQVAMARTQLYALPIVTETLRAHFDVLHQACNQQHKIALRYQDASTQPSERIVHPLGLFFWGNAWSLIAWCELRQDFRNFRIDRMQAIDLLDTPFTTQVGQRLEDYWSLMRQQQDCELFQAGPP